jgi:hypothetical protein
MVNAVRNAVLQRDGDQRADDAFGHRSQIMTDAGVIWSIVRFDDPSMPNNHKAALFAPISSSPAALTEDNVLSRSAEGCHGIRRRDQERGQSVTEV